MASYPFLTVDVFTAVRFGGNPLAVFPDARGIPDEAMAQIAREFNYSEITFVLPPDDPSHTARVRIFTPNNELPFAGHPNVGTGFVLGRELPPFGQATGERLQFEELAGVVAVDLIRANGRVCGASITAPRPLETGPEVDPALAAACASLARGDLVTANHEPQFASVGLPIVFAEVRDVETLSRAKPYALQFEAANAAVDDPNLRYSLYCYAIVSTEPLVVRGRLFAPLEGITEDPATGSAAGALGGLLASLRPDEDLDLHVRVLQGVEMGRPSEIELDVRKRGGSVEQVVIGGRCVEVMRGTIEL